MLAQETQDAVAEVVGKMTDNDEAFTAFDVTHVIRCTVDAGAPHHEVKSIVHDLFAQSQLPLDYGRTSVDIDGGGKNCSAFVYHPQSLNPMDYDPRRFQDIDGDPFDDAADPAATPTPPVPAPTVQPTQPTPTPAPAGLGRCDKRGRICVPAKVMRRLGCYPGHTAWVVPGTNQMTIHRDDPGNSRVPYRVDRSGNIRISAQTAREANMSRGRRFAIANSASGQTVVMVS